MKKKVLLFIMLFAMGLGFVSGCKDDKTDQSILVVDGKEIVATINGVNYSADQVYDNLINLDDNANYVYEKLNDLLIKNIVPVSDSNRSKINNEVEKWKKDIQENATINGKSYKEALNEALKEENVASEEELIEKKIFELQKQIINNDYSSKNKKDDYSEFVINGKVYHISQILVSVSTNGNSDAFGVNVSESAAKKLYDVTNALLKGEKFYNVALKYSDDSNTKDNGGDMGLVTLNDATSTSFPSELKYALASYSVYLENASLTHPEYLNDVYQNGIEAISQKYIDLLGEIYSDGSTQYVYSSPQLNSTSRVYGRNVIFNSLFNSRTFRFIQSNETTNVKSMNNVKMPVEDSSKFSTTVSTQNILMNDEGYPILVVRSDSGIHFVSISMSPFNSEETIKKYYAKDVDYSDSFTSYIEKSISDTDKDNRLEKLNTMSSDYQMYKITNNSSFTGNETFKQYDMFMYYLENGYGRNKFEIVNEKIKKIVLSFIESKQNYENVKIVNAFDENYLIHANNAWYTDYDIVTKEIPLLSCLDRDEEKKSKCAYTPENGFKTRTVGGGE